MTPSGPETRAPNARRLLIVSSELPPGPGGIGRHAHSLAGELHRCGDVVHLIGSQHYVDDAARDAFNSSSQVPITPLADSGDLIRTALARRDQLRRAITSFEPDVIIASGGRAVWLAALGGVAGRTPVIAVAHGTELGGARWSRSITRRAFDQTAAIVAVSDFTKGLVSSAGIGARTTVIHNGADSDRFGPSPHRAARFRAKYRLEERSIVLTVGNVTERKGQWLVVEALPAVLASVPDVHYVMVGRPTDGEAIRKRAAELGVEDHISLLGQLDDDDVVDAHCAADLFVMTSTRTATGDVEGFGIAVLEAALSGVPAVVTTGSGVSESVVEGVTGVLADPNPASIARALVPLLEDGALRKRLGEQAQAHARARGSWQRAGAEYRKVIDAVAGSSAPRLLVVSHTPHYTAADGSVLAFGPTTRELDRLSTLASELVHVAPLYAEPPPPSALPIEAANVRHVPVMPAGGPTTFDRIKAFGSVPRWALTINREMARSDVVHVRCPAGISMVALVLLLIRRRPRDRWVKYAGNWAPPAPDALTYRVQRWWLRRGLARAAVTVNGRWPDQPRWVHAFDNPTLTAEELRAGRDAARSKAPGPPYKVVFVGRLESAKGADVAADVVLELQRRGLDVHLDLIGDGPLHGQILEVASRANPGTIAVRGWLPRVGVEQYLATSHVLLLPTASEGFPKAVAEALAFGCVPVTSAVSSMGQVLGETGGAVVVRDGAWADAIESLLIDGALDRLRDEGVESAPRFSYDRYLRSVRSLAALEWGRSL